MPLQRCDWMKKDQSDDFLVYWGGRIRKQDPQGWLEATGGWDMWYTDVTKKPFYGNTSTGETSRWDIPLAPKPLPGWVKRDDGAWCNHNRGLVDSRCPAASHLPLVGRYLVWRLHHRTQATKALGTLGWELREVHPNDFKLCVCWADGSHDQELPRDLKNDIGCTTWPCIVPAVPADDTPGGFCPGLAWNSPPSRPWRFHTSRVWTLDDVVPEAMPAIEDTPGPGPSITIVEVHSDDDQELPVWEIVED
jgi:hypothetical protein